MTALGCEAVGPGVTILPGEGTRAALSRRSTYPVMAAPPNFLAADFEDVRARLGLPVGCAIVFDPNVPDHQVFRVNAPPNYSAPALSRTATAQRWAET